MWTFDCKVPPDSFACTESDPERGVPGRAVYRLLGTPLSEVMSAWDEMAAAHSEAALRRFLAEFKQHAGTLAHVNDAIIVGRSRAPAPFD